MYDPSAQAYNYCAVPQSIRCTFHAKTPAIHGVLWIKKENENQGEGEPGHCDKYNQLLYLVLPGSQGGVSSISRFCAETRFFPLDWIKWQSYYCCWVFSSVWVKCTVAGWLRVCSVASATLEGKDLDIAKTQSGPFRRWKSAKGDSSISDSKTWQTSNCSLEFKAKWNKNLFANFSYVYCPSQIAKCWLFSHLIVTTALAK